MDLGFPIYSLLTVIHIQYFYKRGNLENVQQTCVLTPKLNIVVLVFFNKRFQFKLYVLVTILSSSYH